VARDDEGLPPTQEIADGIAAELKAKGLRQKDLAAAAGVSEGAVSGWITPDSDADLVQWRRLAAACRKLGLSADRILGVTPSGDLGPGPQRARAAIKKLDEARKLLAAEPDSDQRDKKAASLEKLRSSRERGAKRKGNTRQSGRGSRS
jgi:transcriptional regulator with XRE-family HTH domain